MLAVLDGLEYLVYYKVIVNFDNILLVVYNFAIVYFSALLCLVLVRDKLKRPAPRIAAGAALLCMVESIISVALYVNFGFDGSGNATLLAFLPLMFFCYCKYTTEDWRKLLFVFCMVIHVSSIIAGAFIAIRMFVDTTTRFFEIFAIMIEIVYYLFIGWVINRTITPRLNRIEARNMKHLWLVPITFASIPILFSTFYPIQGSGNILIPIMYIPLLVLSLSVYALILGMLDNVMESARLKIESFELERSNKMKTELMSTISHEARTPLAVLASYAGLVSMELKDKGLEMQTAANLDNIVLEAKRVATLIDRMNEQTPRDETRPERIRFDIGDIIRQTTGLYRHLLEMDGAKLEIHMDKNLLAVSGNPDELTQVLFNVLQNARKAVTEGTVAVSAETSGEHIAVSVEDSGSGIPLELLHRVAERGISGKNSTGLGLAICREIIESHGGVMNIESEENKGTKVTFTLPIYEKADNDGE